MSYNEKKSGTVFTKQNLNYYLNELSKEYKRLGGRKVPVEIVLIGGAAVLANYGFRGMTTDIDAIIPAASIMKEAINHVGDRLGLPNDWLNADFMRTASYSDRLIAVSAPYKTFNQVFNVRVVKGEYLIAMKLVSARDYKNDLSDVVGILAEQSASGTPISFEMIDRAVNELYGGWEKIPDDSVSFLQDVLRSTDMERRYSETREKEVGAKNILVSFEKKYPGVLNSDNIKEILNADQRPPVLAALHEKQEKIAAQNKPVGKSKDDPVL